MKKLIVSLVALVASGSAMADSPVLYQFNVTCQGGGTLVSISAYNMEIEGASVTLSNDQIGFITEPAEGSLSLNGTGLLRFKEVSGRAQVARDRFGRLYVQVNHPSYNGSVWCQSFTKN